MAEPPGAVAVAPGAGRQSKAVGELPDAAAAPERGAGLQAAQAESLGAPAAGVQPRLPAMRFRSIRRICSLAEKTCGTSGT